MINRSHGLSLSRQAQLVGISRGCLYYQRKPPCKAQVQLMHRIDTLHATPPVCRLSHAAQLAQAPRPMCGPSACSHADAAHGRACAVLPAEHQCSPPTAQGLSLLAQEQACGLFQPSLGHGHHLRAHAQGLAVPVCRGRLDSRKVLAWRLSNTMDVQFCVDAVQEAITRWGTPAIFNTDQGSQFTSDTFTTLLKRHGIRISMDGKGAWRDNVFVERLWRSIKHEEIYLKAYDSVRAARNGIAQYLQFYNAQRPHQAHGQATPDEAYFAALPFAKMQAA